MVAAAAEDEEKREEEDGIGRGKGGNFGVRKGERNNIGQVGFSGRLRMEGREEFLGKSIEGRGRR